MFASKWTRQLLRCHRPGVSAALARQFHPAPLASSPTLAPSNRQKQRRQAAANGGKRSGIQALEERIPVSLFRQAIADGLLSYNLKDAVSAAKQCLSLAENDNSYLASQELKKLPTDEVINLHEIALVLNRAPEFRKTSSFILHILADRGDLNSVIYVANEQLLMNNPLSTRLIQQLKEGAEAGLSPHAMVAYGMILQRANKKKESVYWFEKAFVMSEPVKAASLLVQGLRNFPQPWQAYYEAKQGIGEGGLAKKALEVGAFEYHNPRAYNLLAPFALEERNYQKYEEYLLKSAIANHADSYRRLGDLYLILYYRSKVDDKTVTRPSDSFAKKYSKQELRQLAEEWYELAIANGNGQAAFILAGILREENDYPRSEKYLDIAKTTGNCVTEFEKLREIWEDHSVPLDVKEDLMKDCHPV